MSEHRQHFRRLTGHPLHEVMASCARSHANLPGRRELTASIREALAGDTAADVDEALVTRAYKTAVALADEYNRDPRTFNRGRVLDAVETILDAAEQADRLIAAPAPQTDDFDAEDAADEMIYTTRGGHDWPAEKARRAEVERLAKLGIRAG